jgi:peptide chain release factor 2
MKVISNLRDDVESWRKHKQHLHDLIELVQLNDESMQADLETEISKLETDLEKKSFSAMLSGPYDHDDAILAIHAGAGGTDSHSACICVGQKTKALRQKFWIQLRVKKQASKA